MLQDPHEIDGEPHEIAEAAGTQLLETLDDALTALDGFAWSARGAWLTSEHHLKGEMPKGDAFDKTPAGIQLASLKASLRDGRKRAAVLKTAASWNPKSI